MNCRSILLTTAYNNEEYYLSEWLNYHIKLGFSKIVIFEHNWQFNNKNNYSKDKVDFIPFYFDAITNNDFDYIKFDNYKNSLIYDYISRNKDWDLVTNFDCDEFLWFEKYNGFEDFYEKNKNNPVIFIKWRHFGDNGLKIFDRNNTSVLKRFTKCSKDLHLNGKSFLTKKGFELGGKWTSSHNISIKNKRFDYRHYVDYGAELFHFRNKSEEESRLRFRPKVSRSKDSYDSVNQNEIDNFKARDFLYGKN